MNAPVISGSTALCLIIGNPIAHSLTPRMHNAAYQALGIPYCMAPARVTEEALVSAIAGARALEVRGLAVTMPHKVTICPLLDELDPTAKNVGAVNTVVNDGGRLIGYNTDWLGVLRPLSKRRDMSGATVAVLGAGGAAQAAVYACSQSGATVTVLNRTANRAAQLAETYKASWAQLTPEVDLGSFDIIINATPVGMGSLSGCSPLSRGQISSRQIIFETIYAPRETALVQHARAANCTVITGIEMFVQQGAAQFELHTGHPAPYEVMEQVLAST